MNLYLRLLSVNIRSQMQYRLSFVLDVFGSALGTGIEFVSLWAVFSRFGAVGGWTLTEVALLYGLVEVGFATMDMVFSGFDPGFFSTQIRRGVFDQFLLRPASLILQMFSAEFVIRRLGRITQGALVLSIGLALNPIVWTPLKVIYLPIILISVVAFFGGFFVLGATSCFWTVESIEAVNIFTYGGATMLAYPMHIYEDWMRRFFTFIIPGALLVYYPALFLLGRPDPTGQSPLFSFLAPLAGFGTLAVAFGFWNFGVKHYTSTGT